MKIWKIMFIQDNTIKTFIIIAPDETEAIECLDRERPNNVTSEHMIVEDLGTARPVDAKLIYSN